MSLSVKRYSKTYPGGVTALHDVSLEAADGAVFVLAGPACGGKSALLRGIAGLEQPDQGEIALGGVSLNGVPAKKRGVVLVTGEGDLLPKKTVLDNMLTALKPEKLSKEETKAKARAAADSLGIASLLERKVLTLSAGQKQLAALARGLAQKAGAYLLDDPLTALDDASRAAAMAAVRAAAAEKGVPVLYAASNADMVWSADTAALLSDGALRQIGAPAELYACPADRTVAEFIGGMNLMKTSLRRDGNEMVAVLGEESLLVPRARLALFADEESVIGEMLLGVRPERISLRPAEESAPQNALRCTVKEVRLRGPLAEVQAEAACGSLTAFSHAPCALKAGDEVFAVPDLTALCFFSASTGANLLSAE